MTNKTDNALLSKAIFLAGSPVELAKDMGTSKQNVHLWKDKLPEHWRDKLIPYCERKLKQRKAELDRLG